MKKRLCNSDTLKLCYYFLRLSVFSSLILVPLILNNCANQAYPPGGPIDSEAPFIVETEPKTNSLNHKGNKFRFEFNEYIDRRSFEEALFVSPAGVEKPQFEWSGKEVEVILPYALKDNKTYSITVGTDVVDVRNRNRMAESYTLAFSTGDKIDSFSISGKIFDGTLSGILVSAYKIDSTNADTLNPAAQLPDYTTQTGKDGDFTLRNLAAGRYRIFAIQDEYKNLVYDAMLDKAGSYWDEIELSDVVPLVRDLKIKSQLFDTTSLKLYEAEAKDRNHLILKFNRNIHAGMFTVNSAAVADSATGAGLKIKDYYIKEGMSNNIRLFVDSMSAVKYIVTVSGVVDSNGVKIDSNFNKFVFMGSAESDTLKPVISAISVRDSSQSYTPEEPIKIICNDIIDTAKFKRAISFSGKDKNPVKFSMQVTNNSIIEIYPENLAYNSWYKLFIPKHAVMSLNGPVMEKDSIEINFKTEERTSLTSISGTISDTTYVIEATSDSKKKYIIKPKRDKSFRFDKIKEGKYTLFIYQDSDNNKRYSYGNIFPYQKPEKFFYFSDTLKVKAKWPLEDVNIIVP